jgi:hypothetical protein
MEEGIKILKLITGETVMADIKLDKLKKHATLRQPLVFTTQYNSSGTVSMVATKWIESNHLSHRIKTYHIVAAVVPTEMMEQLYIESVEEMEASDSNPLPEDDSDKMDRMLDYLSSYVDEDVEEEDNIIH